MSQKITVLKGAEIQTCPTVKMLPLLFVFCLFSAEDKVKKKLLVLFNKISVFHCISWKRDNSAVGSTDFSGSVFTISHCVFMC